MTYWLETYGCQMNKAESGALEILLQQHNIYPAADPITAHIVILNTCSVRKTAENRIMGRIGFYKKEKSKRAFVLVVIGCMSQRLKDQLQREIPEIDIVVGTFQKQDLISAIRTVHADGENICLTSAGDYRFSKNYNINDFKSLVPIMHGCNNFCSYCIVPYVRGREVSRPAAEILNEISVLDKRGIKEITLLGQNVNSYYYINNGTGLRFHEILAHIVDLIDNIK